MKKLATIIKRIREKHNLTYNDEGSYDEKWSIKVSLLNLLSLLALYTLIVLFIFFLLLKTTGVIGVFMANSKAEEMDMIKSNATSVDSLYDHFISTDMYLQDLKKILRDENFSDSSEIILLDSFPDNYKPDFNKSLEDSILRTRVEYSEQPKPEKLNTAFFFAPVKGLISRSFSPKEGHFGVDISAEKNAVIKTCLEGIVIYSGWDSEGGNVIIIQHSFDFLSVYKHCSKVFKRQGDIVQTGDPLAIIGNTGELTSGYHLHFELWEKGLSLDPEEFISFLR